MHCPSLCQLRTTRTGFPDLRQLDSADSSLKTAEPQTCGVYFVKRRVVDLVTFTALSCAQERLLGQRRGGETSSYANLVTSLPVITSQYFYAAGWLTIQHLLF